jgi:hypothetical protein
MNEINDPAVFYNKELQNFSRHCSNYTKKEASLAGCDLLLSCVTGNNCLQSPARIKLLSGHSLLQVYIVPLHCFKRHRQQRSIKNFEKMVDINNRKLNAAMGTIISATTAKTWNPNIMHTLPILISLAKLRCINISTGAMQKKLKPCWQKDFCSHYQRMRFYCTRKE